MNNLSKRIDGGLLRGLSVWVTIFQGMQLEKQMSEIERETMDYDVVIVGAGPAGLSGNSLETAGQ